MSDKQSAKNVLVKKQDQIIKSAELLAQEVNDWQTIQNYLTRRINDIELTQIQKDKLARYNFIYNQQVSGRYTDKEICEMIDDTYGIGMTQAMKDIRDTAELFNSAFNVNKVFEIKLQLQINRMMLDRANNAGDFRSYAALEKNRAKLLDMLPDHEQTIDDFKGHENIIVVDPAILGVEPIPLEELQQLAKDLRDKYHGKINIPGLNIEEAEIVE